MSRKYKKIPPPGTCAGKYQLTSLIQDQEVQNENQK
jgi:hypothetical protein